MMKCFVLMAAVVTAAVVGLAQNSDTVFRVEDDKTADVLPVLDLSDDVSRQSVVVPGTKEDYQGHPTTLLMPDGKTIYCVWSTGHGGPAGNGVVSSDGGLTWKRIDDRFPVGFRDHADCPSIYRLVGPDGKARLWVWSQTKRRETDEPGDVWTCRKDASRSMPSVMSEDDGRTWKEFPPLGRDFSCIMAFCGIERLKDGSHLAVFHRSADGRDAPPLRVCKTFSKDGGFTWSRPEVICDAPGRAPCEPTLLRSPDGREICCLMRSNTGYRSLMMFSRDEGKTWSPPVNAPWGLSGHRHTVARLRDGRYFVAFRDYAPGSPTKYDFVAWVGSYDALKSGRTEGTFRVRLLAQHYGPDWAMGTDPFLRADCGYPGVSVLPDGTVVAVTYIQYKNDDRLRSLVATRIRAEELDFAKVAARAPFTTPFRPEYKAENFTDYQDGPTRVRAEFGPNVNDFAVYCARTSGCDTAWVMRTDRMPLPEGAAHVSARFVIAADVDWIRPSGSENWCSFVEWYDADGACFDKTPVTIEFLKNRVEPFVLVERVPAKAKACSVRLGTNNPVIPPGGFVRVWGMELKAYAKGDRLPETKMGDVRRPLVRNAFESPTEDANVSVRYRITDPAGVDWSALKVTERGSSDPIPFDREGDVVTLRPGHAWKPGVVKLDVFVRDLRGNEGVAVKPFLVGPKSTTRRVTLRDDGALLVGDRPFFPVGPFGVCLREFNAWNADRCFGDLRDGGMTAAHSYAQQWDMPFLAACARKGMIMWTDAFDNPEHIHEWIAEKGRHSPAVAVWNIGDDTSGHASPEVVFDRQDAANAMDGTRPTSQADVVGTGGKSAYADYVNATDIFMPEIYPVWGTTKEHDDCCVADTIAQMKTCFADIARYGDGSPKAVWPIIQFFQGWNTWQRFPTAQELMAMSFASVIHGALGISWYTYGGFVRPELKHFNYGVTTTQERWAAFTNVTTRLTALAPVILERTPAQPPAPEVVSGAKLDPLGGAAVTALVKQHEGRTYVLAVNAAPTEVRARLSAEKTKGEGKVLWEDRLVKTTDGMFEDVFAPFAVHVYVFKSGR